MKFADSIFTCLCSVYIIFIIIYNIHMSPLFRRWNQSFNVFDKYKLALPLNVGFSYSDTISQWYLMYIAQKIWLLWKIRIEKTEVKMNTGIHHQMSLVIPLFVSLFSRSAFNRAMNVKMISWQETKCNVCYPSQQCLQHLSTVWSF